MPIIEMHLMEGRTTEQKSSAAKAITDAVTSSWVYGPNLCGFLLLNILVPSFM